MNGMESIITPKREGPGLTLDVGVEVIWLASLNSGVRCHSNQQRSALGATEETISTHN
jgi:hypothetical protein